MKKSILILILIGIFSILSMVVFAQSGDNTGVSVTILEEPMIFLGDDEHGNDTIDNDGEIWATLTTDSQVKNCEINWDEGWQAIDKTITSISHIYLSEGTKTVYYQCYDDNDNCITVDDSILIHLVIACLINSDCGTDGYIGNPVCQNNDVWQNYITYICNNAGTYDSYCSNLTALKLKEDCGEDYCEDWESDYCKLDDVYHERTCHDKGCSSGACFDDAYMEEEKVQECGISEYTGSNYCYDGDVYRDYITRGCSDSSCIESTSKNKIEDCTNGCTEGRCKIEVCKTICNFGACYEYCSWQ